MNLTNYDNALKDKILAVFPNVVNSSEDKALENSEDGQAAVTLPLISFWRIGNNVSDSVYSAAATIKRGRPIERDDTHSLVYQEVYVDLMYQIDIWSDRLYEVDTILQETLLFFAEEPYLEIPEDNVSHKYTIPFLVTDVICTNTDLSAFNDTGRLYRQTITIEAKGAPLLFPKKSKLVNTIPIRTYIFPVKGDEGGYEDSL